MSLCVLRSLDGSFDLSLIESLGIKQSREIIFDTCMQVTEVCGVCVCAGIGQSNEPPERWRVLRRDVIRPEQPASSNKWTREEQRESRVDDGVEVTEIFSASGTVWNSFPSLKPALNPPCFSFPPNYRTKCFHR